MGTTVAWANSYIQESLTDSYIYIDLNAGKVGALVIVVGIYVMSSRKEIVLGTNESKKQLITVENIY